MPFFSSRIQLSYVLQIQLQSKVQKVSGTSEGRLNSRELRNCSLGRKSHSMIQSLIMVMVINIIITTMGSIESQGYQTCWAESSVVCQDQSLFTAELSERLLLENIRTKNSLRFSKSNHKRGADFSEQKTYCAVSEQSPRHQWIVSGSVANWFQMAATLFKFALSWVHCRKP